jgi:hypothetical protein
MFCKKILFPAEVAAWKSLRFAFSVIKRILVSKSVEFSTMGRIWARHLLKFYFSGRTSVGGALKYSPMWKTFTPNPAFPETVKLESYLNTSFPGMGGKA